MDRAGQSRLPGTTPAAPDDRGESDAVLAEALASDDIAAALARLLEARLILPVVAEPTESGEADMAVPALVAADGTRALPAFTCLAALAAWDPHARPVPMAGARVVAGAVAEGYDGVVIDVAGPVSLQVAGDLLARMDQAAKSMLAQGGGAVGFTEAAAARRS